MKNIFLILCAFLLTLQARAQSTNDIGKIALSVVMPENIEGLNSSQLAKIETKISQIVTSAGLGASGVNNNFVIYPKFAIYETNVVEGDMQNLTVITSEFSLFVKQYDNNILYASMSKSLKGSGKTKEMALTNAISKIPANDPEFAKFIETSKTKIVNYYEAKCGDIINKSDSFVKMQKYEDALGLLMTIPEEVSSCYNQVQAKSIAAYKAYQTQKCSEIIQKAKTTLAGNNYNDALNILSDIDPSASSFEEAQLIAKKVEDKVSEIEKKEWDFQMLQYKDQISLEKQRINAIKDIAVAYYKRKPKTINYNIIVR